MFCEFFSIDVCLLPSSVLLHYLSSFGVKPSLWCFGVKFRFFQYRRFVVM